MSAVVSTALIADLSFHDLGSLQHLALRFSAHSQENWYTVSSLLLSLSPDSRINHLVFKLPVWLILVPDADHQHPTTITDYDGMSLVDTILGMEKFAELAEVEFAVWGLESDSGAEALLNVVRRTLPSVAAKGVISIRC